MARRWLSSTLLAFVALTMSNVGPASLRIVDQACGAAAAGVDENRAVVIVDTGNEVRRVCVRFSEESITGREALERAGVAPVFKEFGGKGAFVCRLLDTGCPASDCHCDSNTYWSYSRAEAGASTFTVSTIGASTTTVTDGDVEGWKWSDGGTPDHSSPSEVCEPASPAAAVSAPGATRRDPGGSEGGAWAGAAGLLSFVAVSAALTGGFVLARRARRRGSPS